MEQVRRRATKRPPLSCRIAAGSPMRRTVSGRRRGCFGPIAWPNGVAPELVGSGRFRVAHGFFPGPHRPAGCVRERSRRSRTVIRGPSCVADRAWRMCVAARTLQFAIRNSQLATRNSRVATRNSQRATRNAQLAGRAPLRLPRAPSDTRRIARIVIRRAPGFPSSAASQIPRPPIGAIDSRRATGVSTKSLLRRRRYRYRNCLVSLCASKR
ncbi:Uncharacterised protein [Burkholderia oklahomensis]|nr:hypothetical protein BG90_4732 [Burkholderia oklahomensis C6786]SUY27492.1 Uncharacterised protein [Burkholderia oklahomensis]